jgi:hypothetical protein
LDCSHMTLHGTVLPSRDSLIPTHWGHQIKKTIGHSVEKVLVAPRMALSRGTQIEPQQCPRIAHLLLYRTYRPT